MHLMLAAGSLVRVARALAGRPGTSRRSRPRRCVREPRTRSAERLVGDGIFVATETTLFGTLIGTYFYLRLHERAGRRPGVDKPAVLVPVSC